MGWLHSIIQWDSSLARTLGLKEGSTRVLGYLLLSFGGPPSHTESLLKHLKSPSGSIAGSLKNFWPELVENPTWIDSLKLTRPEVSSQSCGFEKTTAVAMYLAHSCNCALYHRPVSPSSEPTLHGLYCTDKDTEALLSQPSNVTPKWGSESRLVSLKHHALSVLLDCSSGHWLVFLAKVFFSRNLTPEISAIEIHSFHFTSCSL